MPTHMTVYQSITFGQRPVDPGQPQTQISQRLQHLALKPHWPAGFSMAAASATLPGADTALCERGEIERLSREISIW